MKTFSRVMDLCEAMDRGEIPLVDQAEVHRLGNRREQHGFTAKEREFISELWIRVHEEREE